MILSRRALGKEILAGSGLFGDIVALTIWMTSHQRLVGGRFRSSRFNLVDRRRWVSFGLDSKQHLWPGERLATDFLKLRSEHIWLSSFESTRPSFQVSPTSLWSVKFKPNHVDERFEDLSNSEWMRSWKVRSRGRKEDRWNPNSRVDVGQGGRFDR